MTTITFIGGEGAENAFNNWGKFHFPLNQPVECDDAHIIHKARNNRFFRVGDLDEVEPHPLDHDANGKKGGSLPMAKRKPGRKPKAKPKIIEHEALVETSPAAEKDDVA